MRKPIDFGAVRVISVLINELIKKKNGYLAHIACERSTGHKCLSIILVFSSNLPYGGRTKPIDFGEANLMTVLISKVIS